MRYEDFECFVEYEVDDISHCARVSIPVSFEDDGTKLEAQMVRVLRTWARAQLTAHIESAVLKERIRLVCVSTKKNCKGERIFEASTDDVVYSPPATDPPSEPVLNDVHLLILFTLRQEKATERHPVKQRQVAPLIDKHWDETNTKEPMSYLSSSDVAYVEGKTGPAGGNWPTQKGLQRLTNEEEAGWSPESD